MGNERGSTHFQGCWKSHPDCAVAYILLLREKLEAARSFVELTYDEEGGEEAADAKHVLDQIDATLNQ